MSEQFRIDRPQPGFFRTRLVRGGPYVPARIWFCCHCTINGGDDNRPHDWRETCDRPRTLSAEIDGRPVDALEAWPRVAGREITEAEYRYLTADADWCRQNAPTEPAANPGQKVDFRTLALPF